jgi:hypothetical protein
MHLAAGGAQAFEGLRRGDLMYEMAIDVNETRSIRLLVNQMIFPDFVVERSWFHGANFAQREWITACTRRMRTRLKACLHRCRQPAEKPPRQSRVVDQDNPLSFGNHVGYIANHPAADKRMAGKEKGPP